MAQKLDKNFFSFVVGCLCHSSAYDRDLYIFGVMYTNRTFFLSIIRHTWDYCARHIFISLTQYTHMHTIKCLSQQIETFAFTQHLGWRNCTNQISCVCVCVSKLSNDKLADTAQTVAIYWIFASCIFFFLLPHTHLCGPFFRILVSFFWFILHFFHIDFCSQLIYFFSISFVYLYLM